MGYGHSNQISCIGNDFIDYSVTTRGKYLDDLIVLGLACYVC